MKLLKNGHLLLMAVSLQRAVFYSSALSFYTIMSHSVLHFSYVIAGVVIFSMVSSGSVFQIIAGKLSDSRSRRETAILGQTIQSFGLIIMGYAFLHLYIFPSIFGFMLTSVGGNSVQSSINAAVADSSTSIPSRVHNFAKIRTAINSGFGFGPLIMGIMLSWLNYGILLEFMGIFSLIFLFFIYHIRGGTSQTASTSLITNNQAYSHLKSGYLTKLSVAAFLLSIVFGQLTSSIPIYEELINHLTNSEVGLLIGLNGLIIVLIQYPVSRLARDALDWRWMTVGSAIYSLSVILLSVANVFDSILFTIILITLGEAIFWATAQALITSISDPVRYGRNLGIFAFGVNIGRGVGAEYGLLIFSIFIMCHTLMWFTIAIPGLISVLLFRVLINKISKEVKK